MKISVRYEGTPGTKKLQNKFRKLAASIKNRKPLFNRIGVQLLNAISENFQQQGHEGTPWAPLSQRTIAGRRNKNKSSIKILEDTGELRRSFASEATDAQVRVGTKKIYAPPHEYGYKNIPERRMLPSKKMGLQLAVDVVDNYIKEKSREAKL